MLCGVAFDMMFCVGTVLVCDCALEVLCRCYCRSVSYHPVRTNYELEFLDHARQGRGCVLHFRGSLRNMDDIMG